MTPDEMIPGVPYLATIRLAWKPYQPDQIIRADGLDGYVTTLGGLVRRECVTNVRPVAIIDWNEWSDGLDIEIGEETRAQWDAALPDGAPLTQAEATTRPRPRLPDLGGGLGL